MRRILPMIVAFLLVGVTAGTAQDLNLHNSLEGLPATLRLGQLDGSGPDVFGMIGDIKLGLDGSFYVLDTRLQELLHFSPTGELLGKTGRGGRGPGEYYYPSRIQVAANGNVLLLDQGNRRIHVYDEGLTLQGQIGLRHLIRDFCILDDRFFVQAVIDGNTIHEMSSEGRILRSFSPPPRVDPHIPPGPLRVGAEGTLGGGRLLCVPERGLILKVGRSTPEILAFGLTGELRWRAEIPEYRQVVPTFSGGGVVMMPDAKTNSQHFLGSTVIVDNRWLLIQLSIIDFTHREVDDGAIDSWVVDLDSQSLSKLTGPPLPRVLEAGHNVLILASNAPFPALILTSVDVFHARR